MDKSELDNALDPLRLSDKGYKSPSHIEKRKTLYRYTSPQYIVEDEVIPLLALSGSERLLDIGCGEGELIEKITNQCLEVQGIDISSGMFRAIQERLRDNKKVHFQVADAQNLPFPDLSFERITALHMLYHIPDIESALSEISRVVTRSGKVIISLNSLESKPMLRKMKKKVSFMFLEGNEYPDLTLRFNLEDASTTLKKFFSTIDAYSYSSLLHLDSPKPYVDYFDSIRNFWNPIPSDNSWKRVLSFVESQIANIINEDGCFEEKNIFGIFVCSL